MGHYRMRTGVGILPNTESGGWPVRIRRAFGKNYNRVQSVPKLIRDEPGAGLHIYGLGARSHTSDLGFGPNRPQSLQSPPPCCSPGLSRPGAWGQRVRSPPLVAYHEHLADSLLRAPRCSHCSTPFSTTLTSSRIPSPSSPRGFWLPTELFRRALCFCPSLQISVHDFVQARGCYVTPGRIPYLSAPPSLTLASDFVIAGVNLIHTHTHTHTHTHNLKVESYVLFGRNF